MSSPVRRPGSTASTPFTNPVLVGTSIVVALIVGVFLSYNANKGLPFVKTFPLKANVEDAAELVVGSEVRIGGFRVGQVNKITAMPPKGDVPPYAQLEMALDGSITGIPEDTVVRVRPRSLLGAKYVELQPGDGNDVKADATLPLENARPTPELDESFNVFDAETRDGLQGTIRNFGNAVAGRGADINRSIVATRAILPTLQSVTETLAEPQTDLDGFVDGLARLFNELRPVKGTFVELFDNGATTLAAIDAAGGSLGDAIEELPPFLAMGQQALDNASPVVRDLADITVALRDGAGRLPRTTTLLADSLESGTRVLRRTPELADKLDASLRALRRVSRERAARGSLEKLTETIQRLEPTVKVLRDAQVNCNTLALTSRNFAGTTSQGDQAGAWLSLVPIIRTQQLNHAAEQDPDLHLNYYPNANGTECESGNESYFAGRVVGNAPGTQPNTTEITSPPVDVTRRARAAGLLDRIPQR